MFPLLPSQVWIRVPATSHRDAYSGEEAVDDTWEWWNTLRSLCLPCVRLGVALELSSDLPEPAKVRGTGPATRETLSPGLCCSSLRCSQVYPVPAVKLARWLGEPVKVGIILTSAFLTNAKGFPVLSRLHQGLVRDLFQVSTAF